MIYTTTFPTNPETEYWDLMRMQSPFWLPECITQYENEHIDFLRAGLHLDLQQSWHSPDYVYLWATVFKTAVAGKLNWYCIVLLRTRQRIENSATW
jgi:hypothetical protein